MAWVQRGRQIRCKSLSQIVNSAADRTGRANVVTQDRNRDANELSMRQHLYTDALAVIAAVIAVAALALFSGHMPHDPALLYASTHPALLLPSG